MFFGGFETHYHLFLYVLWLNWVLQHSSCIVRTLRVLTLLAVSIDNANVRTVGHRLVLQASLDTFTLC